MSVDIISNRLATGLARVAVAIRLAGGDEAAGLERTLAQQQVLLVLTRRHQDSWRSGIGRHGATSLEDLAAELGMTEPDVLAALDTLVREGLVLLAPSPSYAAHRVSVELTAKARTQPPELLNWAADLLAEMDALNAADQRHLLSVVAERILSLQRAGEIPVTKMCVTCRFFGPYEHPDAVGPHHCHLVDAPFGHRQLRLRCPEAEPPR